MPRTDQPSLPRTSRVVPFRFLYRQGLSWVRQWPGGSSLGQHAAWNTLEFSRAHGVAEAPHPEAVWQSIHSELAFRGHQRMVILGYPGSAVRATGRASQM